MVAAKSSSLAMRPGVKLVAQVGQQEAERRMWAGPPSGVTMAGTPLARASRTTLPKVSVWEGKMRRSMLA